MKPGTRVLIVEDDRSIARVVQLQLEHRGFSVRCCHDGISAVQEVPKFRPEVIVLDIMLPGVDGVGVLKKLRSTGIRVPIMMLTAREYELLVFMAQNARRALSRDMLLSRVWEQDFGSTNVVNVYIGYLRKKIDAPGEKRLIQTVRGAGYSLRSD